MRISASIPFATISADKRASAADAAFASVKDTSPDAAPSAAPMDEAAFREFYAETAPKLRAYIRRVCGDAALADDILQDAFYRFLRAGVSHTPQNSAQAAQVWQMKAYLYRTANTLLVDHWRRVARERRWSLRNFLGGEAQAYSEQTGERGAMQLFRRLKPQEQTLLWLAYVEGFDHREIAAAVGVTEKSVRVLLFRARKKLGDALLKEGFVNSPGRAL